MIALASGGATCLFLLKNGWLADEQLGTGQAKKIRRFGKNFKLSKR